MESKSKARHSDRATQASWQAFMVVDAAVLSVPP